MAKRESSPGLFPAVRRQFHEKLTLAVDPSGTHRGAFPLAGDGVSGPMGERRSMPLLRLDARPDLVPCMKLCDDVAGRGDHGARSASSDGGRAEVESLMKNTLANLSALPDVGLGAEA